MDLQAPIIHGNRSLKMYASRLEKLGIATYEDFLFHLPSRYEDYSLISKIANVQIGETVTIQGQILEIRNQYLRGGKIKTMQKATIADGTGTIQATWFNQPFLVNSIPAMSTISISGKVGFFAKKLAIQSPEYEVLFDGNAIHTGRLTPVYPETKGVTSKWLRRQIHTIIQQTDHFEEYLPETLLQKNNYMSFDQAIREVHFPQNLDLSLKARERLAFDELFLIQLAAHKRRVAWRKKQTTIPFNIQKNQDKIETLIASLPFTLTNAQRKAIEDIMHDLSKDKPMNRLLQGDVGSGKTIVAAIAMYLTHLNGFQSVLMAPTEILAEQHYKSIEKLLSPLGIAVELVTGSKKKSVISSEVKRSREISLNKDASVKKISRLPSVARDDDFDILIGTHAVLSEKIKFKNLALVIIDEQQRFGVEQRGIIRQKGNNPHLLTMTATPIPRTVALTMYGDLDLSYLYEMPYGRKKVKTWLVPPEKRDGAYNWIKNQIKTTQSQVFIICPFIEESESMQTIKAASNEYDKLSKEIYPDLKLGLLHGKLKSKEKDAVLQEFREEKFEVLVATPVVEVGIDIPNATIIMIEASDRFGLAQLHQLRGRVGRGDKQSYCLLFAETKNETTLGRLKAMESVYSGAELAELDLKLRGPGNIYGTTQHGIPKLKVASFSDTNLIQKAKHATDEVFPHLTKYPLLEQKLLTMTLQQISPD
jgi:ATP-dependent DNA helicase RecG